MICDNCGESMSGDGYGTVFHCPYAEHNDYWYATPDANPVHCTRNEEDDEKE